VDVGEFAAVAAVAVLELVVLVPVDEVQLPAKRHHQPFVSHLFAKRSPLQQLRRCRHSHVTTSIAPTHLL
jgi:hypothetical protein